LVTSEVELNRELVPLQVIYFLIPAGNSKESSVEPAVRGESAGTTEVIPPATPPELVLDHQGQPEWKCAHCNFRFVKFASWNMRIFIEKFNFQNK